MIRPTTPLGRIRCAKRLRIFDGLTTAPTLKGLYPIRCASPQAIDPSPKRVEAQFGDRTYHQEGCQIIRRPVWRRLSRVARGRGGMNPRLPVRGGGWSMGWANWPSCGSGQVPQLALWEMHVLENPLPCRESGQDYSTRRAWICGFMPIVSSIRRAADPSVSGPTSNPAFQHAATKTSTPTGH